MKNKVVLYGKMSKKAQKEFRRKSRILFTHQNCTVRHKSAMDISRQSKKQQARQQAREVCG